MRSWQFTFVLWFLVAAVACVPSPIAGPSPTPRLAPTVTRQPLPTPTVTPSPTNTPIPATATSTASPPECVAVDGAFQGIPEFLLRLRQEGYPNLPDVGCPAASADIVLGAVQNFRFPLDAPSVRIPHPMIWRSDTRTIHLTRVDSLLSAEPHTAIARGWTYSDTWTEGMPEVPPACAGMTPPSEAYPPEPGSGLELRLPVRGFGKVWCDHMLWDLVGWATEDEREVTLIIQPTQNGLMVRVEERGLTILLDDAGRALAIGIYWF